MGREEEEKEEVEREKEEREKEEREKEGKYTVMNACLRRSTTRSFRLRSFPYVRHWLI